MISCQFCLKEFTNVKYHERYCKNNPNREQPKPKSKKWRAAMVKKRGRTHNQWTKAKETGIEYVLPDEARKKISEANSKRKHTEETKQTLSKIRKAYLAENPDMVPYKLNHYSKGPSYPEVYWRGILDSHGISYNEQHHVSVYSLDFAILSKKIDLEIDGEQHYVDNRIVESDQRRTRYLEENGWTVLRIRWADYQRLDRKEKETFVKNIIEQLA
jgi:very-short-patch-repair endonuclease